MVVGLFSNTQQPVVQTLPDDTGSRRRIAAFLGLLSDDLDRAFADATGGVPLADETAPVVADASATELNKAGLPAVLAPQRSRMESVGAAAFKVGILSTLVCSLGYVVGEGLGGMLATIPESVLTYGIVVPVAVSFLVSSVAIPVALCTGTLGMLRQRAARVGRQRASANVAALAQRGVQGRAAEVDARARSLARDAIRAELPEAIEQDILVAIEEARRGLRRVQAPPDELISTIDDELSALQAALSGFQTRDATAKDASAPLTNLRQTARALQQLAR